MKKRPAELFLRDILKYISEIELYIKGVSKEEFLKSRALQAITERDLEIIGEAVKNIPDDLKIKYSSVPWKKIAGIRDVVIHDYFGVDLDIVWIIAKNQLSDLKKEVEKILELEF